MKTRQTEETPIKAKSTTKSKPSYSAQPTQRHIHTPKVPNRHPLSPMPPHTHAKLAPTHRTLTLPITILPISLSIRSIRSIRSTIPTALSVLPSLPALSLSLPLLPARHCHCHTDPRTSPATPVSGGGCRCRGARRACLGFTFAVAPWGCWCGVGRRGGLRGWGVNGLCWWGWG